MGRVSTGTATSISASIAGAVDQGNPPWTMDIIRVGGASFSLGQQLAAASLPVVLTAAQITTLTPLATVAVTNAGLTALNGAISGTEVQVDVLTMPTVTVTATNLDIRDLSSASDSVSAVQSGTWILGANSGVDIGDVTINNASGAAAVNIQDGGNSITVDGTVAVTQSTSPWIVAGGGTAGTAASGVVTIQGIASMTPVQVSQATGTNLHMVVDSGIITTVSTVSSVTAIANALPAGTNAIGKLAANDGVDIGDVTINNASGGSAVNIQDGGNSITIDGTVAATQSGTWAVSAAPRASGGLLISRLLSANTTNATSVKGSAGQVYGWYLYNANASVRYFKIYNKATAPTVGSDTPVMTIPIPGSSAANVEYTNGIALGTGIGFAITTGVADNDTGAVAANEIVINLLYT